MAEAFASGDLRFAFHPRIPPLQPFCGGIVAKCFGVDAFLGLKIASVAWYLAGGVLIWLLFRTVHPTDRKVALFGTVLYFFFPYMFHMAYSGLRESAKCTLLILLALALVRVWREQSRRRDYLLLGIAAGLGALIRMESLAIGLFCIFCAAIFESSSGGLPVRSFFSAAIALTFTAANALVNHHFFGHAMPDSHFAMLFMRHFGRAAEPGDVLSAAVLIAVLLPLAAYAAARLFRRVPVGYFWGAALFFFAIITVFAVLTGIDRGVPGKAGGFVISLLEGCYYFVVPMALVHVGSRLFLRKFTRAEHAVLIVAAAGILLCILQIHIFDRKLYVSSRYLFPATPLFFGFFLLGWEDFYRWFSPFLPKWLAALGLAASIGGFAFMYAYHLPQPLYRGYRAKSHVADNAAIAEICRLVRSDKLPLHPRETVLSPWTYRGRRSPKFWFQVYPKISVAAYFMGGSVVESASEADYIVMERLPKHIDPRKTHLLGKVKWRRRVFCVWRMK